jgi:hypothetical protein
MAGKMPAVSLVDEQPGGLAHHVPRLPGPQPFGRLLQGPGHPSATG